MKFNKKDLLKRMVAGALALLMLLSDIGYPLQSAYADNLEGQVIVDTTPVETPPEPSPTPAPTDPPTEDTSTDSTITTPDSTDTENTDNNNKPGSEEQQPNGDQAPASDEVSEEESTEGGDQTDSQPSDDAKQDSGDDQSSAPAEDESNNTQDPAPSPTPTPAPSPSPEIEEETEEESEEETEEKEEPEEETPQPLSIESFSASAPYAVAGLKSMSFSVKLTGGSAPCDVHYTISQGETYLTGEHITLTEGDTVSFEYLPQSFGVHNIALTVTDSTGAQQNAALAIPVALGDSDDVDAIMASVPLGDDPAANLAAVASSQLGAGQNKLNFIIDENGAYHYYTRFGEHVGDTYMDDWKAAFITFCLNYAGVSRFALSRPYDIPSWYSELSASGLIRAVAEHTVSVGDIVFFGGEVYNAGIVDAVYDGCFTAVLPGTETVGQFGYNSSDASILGFYSFSAPAEEPEQIPEENTEETEDEELTGEVTEPLYLDIEITADKDTVSLGETVTLSAVIPEGVNADEMIWQWQIYSAQNDTWIDIDEAWEPSYTFTADMRHILNPIRVLAQTMPAMAAMALTADDSSAAPQHEVYLTGTGFSLTMTASDEYIYWNPFSQPTYDEEGFEVVKAGNDENDGLSAATPVRSLGKAVSSAAGKTIVCMNLYSSYGDGSLDSTESVVTIISYDGGDNSDYAHQGQFISSKTGSFVAKNLRLSQEYSVIDLYGGELLLSTGNEISGPIHLSQLSVNYLPITVTGANNVNGGKYLISFDSDYSGRVGIAKGDATTSLQLTQELLDKGWQLLHENGGTYAYIAPSYDAVYVDGVNGSDTNVGNSEEYPVRSFAKALELMGSTGVSTLYVMGTVNLTASGEYTLSADQIVKRHASCSGAMFNIMGGDQSFGLNVSGSVSGPDAETASAEPIFSVSAGRLIITGNANISGAASYAVTMSGGSFEAKNCNNNINSDGIVSGNAVSVDLDGSTLSSASNPLVDVTVSTGFTADGAVLSGPAANTLVIDGKAELKNGLTVNNGSGSVVSTGTLNVDGVHLSKISANGALSVTNCTVTDIENTGSSTTLETVSVSTLSSAGTVQVNNSDVTENLSTTGATSTLTVNNSNNIKKIDSAAGSVTLNNSVVEGDVTADGDVTLNSSSAGNVTGNAVTLNAITAENTDPASSAAASITAAGDVTVNSSKVTGSVSTMAAAKLTGAELGGSLSAEGNVTLTGSTVAGPVSGNDVRLEKNGDTRSSALSVDADGNAVIQSAQDISGFVKADGTVEISDTNVTGDITSGGALTLATVTAQGNIASGGDAKLTDVTANISGKKTQVRGSAEVSDSIIADLTVSGSVSTLNNSTIGTLDTSGTANITNTAITSGKTANSTINNSDKTIGSLTASGSTTLVSGTVKTLVSSGAEVFAKGGVIESLELKGSSSVVHLGGDDYAASVPQIKLSGSNAYIKLYAAPKDKQIKLSIPLEINGRLVAEGVGTYDASPLIDETTASNGILYWTDNSMYFNLDGSGQNVVLKGTEGIYVDTLNGNPGNTGTFESPFKTFAEAAAALNGNSGLPRTIYVIGSANVVPGDSLNITDPEARVTVVANSGAQDNFITVNDGASFAPGNVDFDGAGSNTLIKVESGATLDLSNNGATAMSSAATAINNAGTVYLDAASITCTGTAIVNSGTLTGSGAVSILAENAGTAIVNSGALTLGNVGNTITLPSGTAVDNSGSLTLGGSISMGSGTGVYHHPGDTTVLAAVKADISISGSGTGIKLDSGRLSLSGTPDITLGSGIGIDMNDGTIVTGSAANITVSGANSIGVDMKQGTISGLGGSISISDSGTGVSMESGTASVSASIYVNNADSLGVKVTGGTLTYSGGHVYGPQAMLIENAKLNFNSGYTCDEDGKYSASQGIVTLNNSTLSISGGRISRLVQNGGSTTAVSLDGYVYSMLMNDGALRSSGGYIDSLLMEKGSTKVTGNNGSYTRNIYSMTMNGGQTDISGGSVYSVTMNKGVTNVSGGSVSSSVTLYGGLAASTLNQTGGTINNVRQYGGTFNLKGGSVTGTASVYKVDSEAQIWATGGSLYSVRLLGYAYGDQTGSVLHTNGSCDIGTVAIGEGSGNTGANSYIALSGTLTKNSSANTIDINDVAGVNYVENYSVVKPEEGSGFDASKELEKFDFSASVIKRYNLVAGSGQKATHIVFSFDGVFIDTQNGDDSWNGLSYGSPVRTFKRAEEVMRAKYQADNDCIGAIYVVNMNDPYGAATAIVSGNDAMDLSGVEPDGKHAYVTPFADSCQLLIQIPSGASLTLNNVDISGTGNDSGTNTQTLMDVDGTLTATGSYLMNSRQTVLDVSGAVTLNNSIVTPHNNSRSSATNVKLTGGSLTLQSGSSVMYGGIGVDMSGASTLSVESDNSIIGASTGLKITGGTADISGQISGSTSTAVNISGGLVNLRGSISNNYSTGVNMSGGTFNQYGDITGRYDYYYNYSSSKGGVYMTAGQYTMYSGADITRHSGRGTAGGVTVLGGTFEASGATISHNYSSANGGGLLIDGGTVTLSGTTISNNKAGNASTGNGGGIMAVSGSLRASNITVSGNYAGNSSYSGHGGGIYLSANADVNISGTNSVSSNYAYGSGGGVYFACGSSAVLSGLGISSNHAYNGGNGGGIYFSGSSAKHGHGFTGCSVTSNEAKGSGGGVYNNCTGTLDLSGFTAFSSNHADGDGGAIYSVGGTILLGDNKTGFTGNYCSGSGGALYIAAGSVTGSNINFSGSHAGTGSGDKGGVVYLGAGSVSLTGSTLYNNSANTSSLAYQGGAVYVNSGTAALDQCTIVGARSVSDGGAVYLGSGTVYLNNATVSGSFSGGNGGAAYVAGNESNVLELSKTDLHGSSADAGGAVYMANGTVKADNAKIYGCKATNGDGGAVYIVRGSLDLTGVNSSVTGTLSANTASKSGGSVYVPDTFEGTVKLDNAKLPGTATNGNGGAVYIGSGDISAKGADFANSAATAGSGGAVYLNEGSIDLTSAKLNNSSAGVNGGALCIAAGSVIASGADLSGSRAGEMGGAVYAAPDVTTGSGSSAVTTSVTLDLDAAKLNNSSAKLGGGLYMGGGSVSMLQNADASASAQLSNCSASETEQPAGAAIHMAGGTLDFYGSASKSTTSAAEYTVCISESATLNHQGGTVTGGVYAAGDYVITLPDAWVDGQISLVTNKHPLKISENSTSAGSNKFYVNAPAGQFEENIVVNGTLKVPAVPYDETGWQFQIPVSDANIKTYSQQGDDIVGGTSTDVYWDPTGTYGKDTNGGGSYEQAVETLTKAKEILAKKGPASRIILCSTATAAEAITDSANSLSDGLIPATTINGNEVPAWNARIVRYSEFSGTMFSGVANISNMVISGEAHTGGIMARDTFNNSPAIIYSQSAVNLNNVEICNHDMYANGIFSVGGEINLTGCQVHDCDFYMDSTEVSSSLFGMSSAAVTIDNTKIYNNINDQSVSLSGALIRCGDKLTIKNNSTISNNRTVYHMFYIMNGVSDIDDSAFINNTCESVIFSTNMGSYNHVYCYLTNSVFTGNVCKSGIVSEGHVDADNCTFENNTSQNGGCAIRLSYANKDYISLDVDNCSFINNSSGDDGGAIYSVVGFSIDNSTFTGNTATGYGGAVYIASSEPMGSADLNISGSTFNGNESGKHGGAVFFGGGTGTLTVSSSAFENNTSKGTSADSGYGSGGGAICVDNSETISTVVINEGCKFTGNNSAANGGALEGGKHNLTIEEGTEFVNNTAAGKGGALYSVKVMKAENETVTLGGVTFSGNTAGESGGAAHITNRGVSVDSGTFTGNTATGNGGALYTNCAVNITGGTFSGNSAATGGAVYASGNVTISGGAYNNNTANSSGGALYVDHGVSDAAVSISSAGFSGNSAATGGVIYSMFSMDADAVDTGSVTVTSCTFDGNSSTSSGAILHARSSAPAAGQYTASFDDCTFTRNFTDDGALIFTQIFQPLKLTDCVFGSETAAQYPASKEAALSSGGNSGDYVVYCWRSLDISGSSFCGNYCPQAAIYCRILKVEIDNSHVDHNYGCGLMADDDANLESISISSSSFDGNSDYGAYIGKFATSATTTGGTVFATINGSSFDGNGKSGLRMGIDQLFIEGENSSRKLSISESTISGNGGSGLYLTGDEDNQYSGRAELTDTVISGNGSMEDTSCLGGGVHVGANVKIILDSTVDISGNEAYKGGAVYWEEQKNGLDEYGGGAVLSGNKAVSGGAIYANQPVSFAGFVIEDNEAEQGGGLYVDASTAKTVTIGGKNDTHSIPAVTFRNNRATNREGGAIYISAPGSTSCTVVLNKAVIEGNSSVDTSTTAPAGKSSGIYNGGAHLNMAGDDLSISDVIYLNDDDYHIYLTKAITGGSYNIALNTDNFAYGSVVVEPGENSGVNAAASLPYTTAVVSGCVFSKGECNNANHNTLHPAATIDSIVLKRCIFVDGTRVVAEGETVTGATPADAFPTMADALEAAKGGNFVIYVCGQVTVEGKNNVWAVENGTAEIHRYTGFAVGGDISLADEPYLGDMIVVNDGAELTVDESIINLSGRHNDSDTATPNGSILSVSGTVKLGDISLTGNNSKASNDGGAIRVNDGGTVSMSGTVTISEANAGRGGAVYVAPGGTVNVTGSLAIDSSSAENGGGIYNEGTVNVSTLTVTGSTASVNGGSVYNLGDFTVNTAITADGEFYVGSGKYLTMAGTGVKVNNGSQLLMDIGDPRDGRIYVHYNEGTVEESTNGSFVLTDALEAAYLRRINGQNLVLSQSNIVYVKQGFSGAPEGLQKGLSADYPYSSIREAYEALSNLESDGGLIYIVDTVTVDSAVTIGSNYYTDAQGTVQMTNGVSFRRYSQPIDENGKYYSKGERSFEAGSNTGALFNVSSSGVLTLDGVILDGHNYSITGDADDDNAFTYAGAVTADSPLVNINGTGQLVLTNGASLTNNTNSNESASGSAVYNASTLCLEGGKTISIDGSVYLTASDPDQDANDADSFITVNADSISPASHVRVIIAETNAYDGRVIAQYNAAPAASELSKYSLPDAVAENFKLAIDGKTIVLRSNRAVYVDGKNGNDANEGTPDAPIHTLREAYQRLSGHGGTIYIVGTVTIPADSAISLGDVQYYDGETVTISEGTVSISRYSKPSAYSGSGYSRESFTGALLEIESGAQLNLYNITVDGHNQPVTGRTATVNAGAVSAGAPMIAVRGNLVMDGASLINNTNTATFGGAVNVYSTGSLEMKNGASFSGNAVGENKKGAAVNLNGSFTLGGNVSFGADQYVYFNGKDVCLDVSQALSGIVPVELSADFIDHGKVIARYDAALKPNAESFSLTADNTSIMESLSLSKTTDKQNVLLLASYAVTYNMGAGAATADDAPTLAGRGVDFNTSIKAEGSYVLPGDVSITVHKLEGYSVTDGVYKPNYAEEATVLVRGQHYDYDPATGDIRIVGENIVGSVTISAEGIPVYSIEYEVDPSGSMLPQGTNPTSVLENGSFTAQFYFDEGYEMTDIDAGVSVTLNGSSLEHTKELVNNLLTVSVAENLINSENEEADRTVTVKLATTLKSYSVSEQIEGVVFADGAPETVEHGAALDLTLQLEDSWGYQMPESVTILSGAKTLKPGEDFSYENGVIIIEEGVIVGEVIVRGEPVIKQFKLTFGLTPEDALKAAEDAPKTLAYKAALETGISLADPDGGYLLPDSITIEVVSVGGSGTRTLDAEKLEYAYDPADGSISIEEGLITGDVTITAQATLKNYDVTVDIANTDHGAEDDKDYNVDHGKSFEIELTVDTGYELDKDDITVTIGGVGYTGFTYNDGVLTIPAEDVTGEIAITGSAELKSYKLTAKLADQISSEPSISEDGNEIKHFEKLEVTLSAAEGYDLSAEIKVTMGGQTLSPGTDYTYSYSEDNKDSATVTIQSVSGDVHIEADSVIENYPVSYTYTPDAASGSHSGADNVDYHAAYSSDITAATGYKIVEVEITGADADYTPNDKTKNGDVTGGTISIGKDKVKSGFTVTVTTAKRVYKVTDTMDYADLVVKHNGTDDTQTIPTVTHGEENLTITIDPADSHDLPKSETVKVIITDPDTGDVKETLTVANNGITYDEATGVITLAKDKVAGPIEVQGTPTIKTYTVNYVYENTVFGTVSSHNNPDKLDHGSGLTAKFTMKPGYENPAYTIEMDGSSMIESSGWNGSDGITVTSVTGNVTITLKASLMQFDVGASVENTDQFDYSVENGATYGQPYTIELVPATGYDLPEEAADADIQVTIGGQSYTGYTYEWDNKDRAAITIPANAVTGDIKVTGAAIPETYNVTCTFDPEGTGEFEGSATVSYGSSYTATITADVGYKITGVTVMRGKDNLSSYASGNETANGDKTAWNVNIPAKVGENVVITGDVEITVTTAKRQYKLTNDVSNSDIDPDGTSDTTTVTDGGSVTVTIDPDEGFTYPDTVTIKVLDPDYPDHENPVKTLVSGTDYTYDPDTGEIVIKDKDDNGKDVITGPVIITGDALHVYDVAYQYFCGEDEDSNETITIPDGGNPTTAVEGKSFTASFGADTGYEIKSITVTNDENATVASNTDSAQITVNSVSGNMTVSVVSGLIDYTFTTNLGSGLSIKDEADLTNPLYHQPYKVVILHDENTTMPETIEITMDGREEELVVGTDYTYDPDTGEVTINKNVIEGNITLIANGILFFTLDLDKETLTAVEGYDANKETATIDLSSKIALNRLEGKTFTLKEVSFVPAVSGQTVKLLDSATFEEDYVRNSGYNTANYNFGLTINGVSMHEKDTASFKFADDLAAADAVLKLQLYNANAIILDGTVGTITLKLVSDKQDVINLRVDVKREISSINVTVPLVLVMKTNIDGGYVVADENGELGSYGITNNSSMRVQLTDADIENKSSLSRVEQDPGTITAVDTYYVGVDSSEDIYVGERFNPIQKIATGPLSFVTSGNDNEGLHLATVTYTVEIPKEDPANG